MGVSPSSEEGARLLKLVFSRRAPKGLVCIVAQACARRPSLLDLRSAVDQVNSSIPLGKGPQVRRSYTVTTTSQLVHCHASDAILRHVVKRHPVGQLMIYSYK